MDLVASVRKEGSRGGRSDFKWSDVQGDQHRENYLGHSLMAPVGRWQKNRDLSWYAKGDTPDDTTGLTPAEVARRERQAEMVRVKAAEREALSKALGYEVNPDGPLGDGEGSGANNVPVTKRAGFTPTETVPPSVEGREKDVPRPWRRADREDKPSKERKRERDGTGVDEGRRHRHHHHRSSRRDRSPRSRSPGARDPKDRSFRDGRIRRDSHPDSARPFSKRHTDDLSRRRSGHDRARYEKDGERDYPRDERDYNYAERTRRERDDERRKSREYDRRRSISRDRTDCRLEGDRTRGRDSDRKRDRDGNRQRAASRQRSASMPRAQSYVRTREGLGRSGSRSRSP